MKTHEIARVIAFKDAMDRLTKQIDGCGTSTAGARLQVERAALNLEMMRQHGIGMLHDTVVATDDVQDLQNWIAQFDGELQLATKKLLETIL